MTGHKNSRSIHAPKGDISRLDFAVQLNIRHHMEPTPGSFDEAFFNLTRRSADELHCKRFKKKDDKRQMLEIFRNGVERRAGGSSGDGLTTRRSFHDRAPRTTTCYLVETGASLERNRQLTCRRARWCAQGCKDLDIHDIERCCPTSEVVSIKIMMQILASTGSEGPLADVEKGFMDGRPPASVVNLCMLNHHQKV